MHRFERLRTVIVAVVLVTAAALVIARPFLPAVTATLHDHWLLIFAVSTVHSAMSVMRKHRRASEEWPQSWLAAAPLSATSVRLARCIDSCAPLFLHYTVACSALLAIALLAHDLHASLLPLFAVTSGGIVGSVFAFCLPPRGQSELREASRYAPTVVAGAGAVLRPSDRALSHWPVARAISMGRPENARLLFLIVATCGIQAGASALRGLAILALWALAGYLISLASAGVLVAYEAAAWLKPTPLSFANFAWPLVRRLSVHQVVGTVVAAAGLIAAGAGWLAVVCVSVVWMIAVGLVYALALQRSYRA